MRGQEWEHRLVERDGAAIGLSVRQGEDAPVVLVHGVMADATGWLPVANAIDIPERIAVVNRRGRAPSDPLGGGYSVRTDIDDLHAVLDSLGNGAHLVGHSYGGLLAAEVAVERSDVRSLTLFEPISYPFAPQVVEPVKAALADGDPGQAVEIINIDLSGFSRAHVAALRSSAAWPVLCDLARPLGEELEAVNRYTPRYERYPGYDGPVTMIVGEQNLTHPVYGEAFERFRTGLPGARVEVLAGQGHLAHVEAPEVLGRALADALTQQTQRT